ncbi:MAG: hypothetical protein INR70_39875 [Parafilimonas terrae]|nr:hypothetical protein [Parafilimonas terrae]
MLWPFGPAKLGLALCLAVSPMSSSGDVARAQNGPGARSLVCLAPAETRNLFLANKLVQPFVVLRDAARAVRAEAIDIQMCRFNGALVYDVTLLDGEGRVFHRLVGATDGTPVGPPPGGDPSSRSVDGVYRGASPDEGPHGNGPGDRGGPWGGDGPGRSGPGGGPGPGGGSGPGNGNGGRSGPGG